MEKEIKKLKVVIKKLKEAKEKKEKEEIKDEAVKILTRVFNPEAREFVKKTYEKPETTKGHYREYLSMLSNFSGLYRQGFIEACLNNGGEAEGIEGALMILNQ